jgi:hypothetical protein
MPNRSLAGLDRSWFPRLDVQNSKYISGRREVCSCGDVLVRSYPLQVRMNIHHPRYTSITSDEGRIPGSIGPSRNPELGFDGI